MAVSSLMGLRDLVSVGLVVVALSTMAVGVDFAYDTIALGKGRRREVAGDVVVILGTSLAIAGAALAGVALLTGAFG